jgi:hypothetical protein
VSVYVPPLADGETVIVIVEVPDWPGLRVNEDKLKVAVTPLGTPETDRLIVCEEPEPLAAVKVTVALACINP